MNQTSNGLDVAGITVVLATGGTIAGRSARADELGQPRYCILPNAVLFDIAARQPMTEAELGAIKGIGPHKIETWGVEILQIVGQAR